MKSLKYEGVVKLKIFWSLRRLEAGLSGFKSKWVHYGKFGLQIIIYHPYYTKPNRAFSPLITPKPTSTSPHSQNPSSSSSLPLSSFALFSSGDGELPAATQQPPPPEANPWIPLFLLHHRLLLLLRFTLPLLDRRWWRRRPMARRR